MRSAARASSTAGSSPDALPPEYYRQYVDVAANHWWFRGRERILQAIVTPHVALEPRAVVVDIGSGPGGPTRSLFPTQRIVAVDLSAGVLSSYVGADAALVGDAARPPLRARSVDAICAFDVLEHLEHDDQALSGWHDALVPGGWVIVTVPAYQSLWSVSDDVDRHYRRYRASALAVRLRDAGFDVVRVSYFNMLLLPGIALVKWATRALSFRRAAAGRNRELDLRLPAWIERRLEAIFVAEAQWLRRANLPAGVSIVALGRRGADAG